MTLLLRRWRSVFAFFILIACLLAGAFLKPPAVTVLPGTENLGRWQGNVKLQRFGADESVQYYLPANLRLIKFKVDKNNKSPQHVKSPVFTLPARLGLFVAGQFNLANSSLSLILPAGSDGQSELTIPVRIDALNSWQYISQEIPDALVGQSAFLQIESKPFHAASFLGVSTPFVDDQPLGLYKTFIELSQFILYFLLVLLPGCLLAPAILRWGGLPPRFVVMLMMTCVGILGYLGFWSAYFFRVDSQLATLFLILMILIFTVKEWWHPQGMRIWCFRESYLPLFIMLLLGVFYLSVMQYQDINPMFYIRHRFTAPMPIDNQLPWNFAKALHSLGDLQMPGPWQYSDRPPLQTGVLLFTPLLTHGIEHQFRQMAIGMTLQLTWVPAIILLLRTIGLTYKRIVYVLLLCVGSVFFLFHTVYVWPKLLAAAFGVLCLSIVLYARVDKRACNSREMLILAMAAALSMLSHGGSMFFLLPVLCLLLWRGMFPGLRTSIMAALVFFTIYGGWIAYQKGVDPPGDRLLRMHVAGDRSLEQRSFSESFRLFANKVSLQRLINQKKASLHKFGIQESLSMPFDMLFSSPVGPSNILLKARRDYFVQTYSALGVLPLGGLLALLYSISRPDRMQRLQRDRLAWALVGLGHLCLVFWLLVIYAYHSIHVNALGTMVILFAGFAALMANLPALLAYLLLVVQLYLFTVYFLLTYIPFQGEPRWLSVADMNLTALSLSIVSLSLLIFSLHKLSKISGDSFPVDKAAP